MVGGVISDIYHAEDRNMPMALFSGAALFGTGLGPMIASAIVQHTTWRWVFYSHAIVSGIFVVIMYILLKETRGSILLSRKARKLNQYYESLEEAGYYGLIMPSEGSVEKQSPRRIRWKVKSDEERESLAKMISISCYRPFREDILELYRILSADHIDRRSPLHGTRSLLFLSVGRLQLGCALFTVRFDSVGFSNELRLHTSTSGCNIHRYALSDLFSTYLISRG
jgi:MFS family permease